MRKKKPAPNYLSFIPIHNEAFPFETDEEGKVTILVEHKGLFYWLTQKLMKKPRISQVHLEEMGSFIWPLIDGKQTVYDISIRVKEEFGEKAEPLYDRLVTYFAMLEQYDFVRMLKPAADGAELPADGTKASEETAERD